MPLRQTNLSEQTMKITKLIEKFVAVALVATAVALASCEKTVEGIKTDATAASDAAAEKTEAAVEATKDAAADAKEENEGSN